MGITSRSAAYSQQICSRISLSGRRGYYEKCRRERNRNSSGCQKSCPLGVEHIILFSRFIASRIRKPPVWKMRITIDKSSKYNMPEYQNQVESLLQDHGVSHSKINF